MHHVIQINLHCICYRFLTINSSSTSRDFTCSTVHSRAFRAAVGVTSRKKRCSAAQRRRIRSRILRKLSATRSTLLRTSTESLAERVAAFASARSKRRRLPRPETCVRRSCTGRRCSCRGKHLRRSTTTEHCSDTRCERSLTAHTRINHCFVRVDSYPWRRQRFQQGHPSERECDAHQRA